MSTAAALPIIPQPTRATGHKVINNLNGRKESCTCSDGEHRDARMALRKLA